jgi:hypothetical protein
VRNKDPSRSWAKTADEILVTYCSRLNDVHEECAMPSARFIFDGGSGAVLWTTTPEDRDMWDIRLIWTD